MRSVFVWCWALLLLLMGAGLLFWVGYNFLVEMQPEAEERNPLPALILGSGMLVVAVYRIRILITGGEASEESDA